MKHTFSLYALLFLLSAVVYFSVSGHGFMTAWDDQWMIFNKYTFGGLSVQNLSALFSETYQGQYSPINQLSYTVLYAVFGANPQAFHLASLLWHLVNVCLVFAFVKTLLNLRESENTGQVSGTAFLTALLFALHPINTEAVAWISASKVPLYAMFGLSALLCYMHYLKSGSKFSFSGSIVFFLLSFGCKEQAFVLPLAVLLIDWFSGRDFRDKKLWIEKLPFLALMLLGGIFTLSLRSPELIQYRAGYPLWQRLIFACYALTEYLTKLAVPLNLMYVYPFPMAPGYPLPVRFLIYPLIVSALAGVVVYYRKHAVPVFGALFFLLNLSLSLHLVSISRVTIVADRYVYLSGIGFFMVLSWYGLKFFSTLSKLWKKILLCCTFAVYLLYLAGYAQKRSLVWQDNDSLKKEMRELLDKRKSDEKSLPADTGIQ